MPSPLFSSATTRLRAHLLPARPRRARWARLLTGASLAGSAMCTVVAGSAAALPRHSGDSGLTYSSIVTGLQNLQARQADGYAAPWNLCTHTDPNPRQLADGGKGWVLYATNYHDDLNPPQNPIDLVVRGDVTYTFDDLVKNATYAVWVQYGGSIGWTYLTAPDQDAFPPKCEYIDSQNHSESVPVTVTGSP